MDRDLRISEKPIEPGCLVQHNYTLALGTVTWIDTVRGLAHVSNFTSGEHKYIPVGDLTPCHYVAPSRLREANRSL